MTCLLACLAHRCAWEQTQKRCVLKAGAVYVGAIRHTRGRLRWSGTLSDVSAGTEGQLLHINVTLVVRDARAALLDGVQPGARRVIGVAPHTHDDPKITAPLLSRLELSRAGITRMD